MDKACRSGQMAQATKVNGKIAKLMVRALSSMLMATFSLVNGDATRPMDTVSTSTATAHYTKETGRTTSKMEEAQRYGAMSRSLKANT